jgi:hypothetical protein
MDQTSAGLRLAGDITSNNPLVDIGYYTGGTVSHANWVTKFKVLYSGTVTSASTTMTLGGNQVLHAGNYTTYALPYGANFNSTVNTNSGFMPYWTNSSTGTSAYVEGRLTSGDRNITWGVSHNYSSSEWNQAWLYSGGGHLALKTQASYYIRFYTGGYTDGYERYRIDDSGRLISYFNTATGIANNDFNVAKSILGNLHIVNGDGTSGNNKQAALTFQGDTGSEAQAGIYVSNNNSSGTAMGFATTDSYAVGPKLFMTATNGGVVNFPRARPTYAGNTILDAANYNSYAPSLTGSGASGTWSITTTGNVASRGQSNWNDATVINNVVGLLAWKNYGNSHVIFDASASTSPSGTGVNSTNSTAAWTATYPTLMGWNGSQTYGVRVDSARVADTVTHNASRTDSAWYNIGWFSGNPSPAYSCDTVQIQSSTGNIRVKNSSCVVQAPYQSDHDFPTGAYIQTDISPGNGEPWTCEITAFNYGNGRPTKITINAYNYGPGTYYAGYAIATGLGISGMSVFQNSSGYLCLYIPSQGYWNAYNVNWYVNYNGNSSNRVTSISNSAKPGGISYENSISPTYSLDASNYTSYAPSLTGTGASGSWGISISGSSASCTGNAATVSNGVYTNASTNSLSGILNFGAMNNTPYANATGTSCGISFGGYESGTLNTYGIFTQLENVGGNYSKLTINYHTGIRLGASTSYGGIRFYSNYVSGGSEIFSVGNGDSNVRVANSLYVYSTINVTSGIATNQGNDISTFTGGVSLYSVASNITSTSLFKRSDYIFGGHGGLAANDYATYYVMDTVNRAWIWRFATSTTAGTNVASIRNNDGAMALGAEWNGSAGRPIFAQLNICQGIGGATLYRDIDLRGSWGAGEGHAITATHGSSSANIVGQMVFQHDSPGSRIKWGRLYASGDQSTYPMELISSGSSANLYVTGDIVAYYSDERLKTRISGIEGSLNKILSLNGFRYVNNDLARENGYISDKVQLGLSAQEVQRVAPEIVKLAHFDMEMKDGQEFSKSGENYLTLDYAKLVPVLVEAIKELNQKVEEQDKLIKSLLDR